MKQDSKIYVAGHRGLVGSALMRQLQARGYRNLVTRTHAELDLIEQAAVRDFFAAGKLEYVLLAAAKVGGIHACNTSLAEFKRRFANQTDVQDLLPKDWVKL
jgi:GDP-L-fucose synthase